jgi:hypothetical protein
MSIFLRNLTVRYLLVALAFLAWSDDTVDVTLVNMTSAPALNKTFVIGDSTSWRLTGEYDGTANLWAERHPDWLLDVIGGSNVNTLTTRVQYHLANVDSNPSMFVMALGTNPDPNNDWWKWKYEQALNLLPATTKVILVIPFRGTRVTAEGRAKSDAVTRYAGYLHDIAAERDKTIVANWRGLVLSDPTMDPATGIGKWTNDGVHQRVPYGRAEWLNILDRAVARF